MSAIKRHIEDMCEEIAAKVGLKPDDVMDIFNIINEHYPRVLHLYTDAELWDAVERECERHAAFLRTRGVGSIKTGYIPVEYNHYKELVRKAVMFDKMSEAQTENLQSMKKIEELYDKAISSMREYQGKPKEQKMCKYCKNLFDDGVVPVDLIYDQESYTEVEPFEAGILVDTWIYRGNSGEPQLCSALANKDGALVYKSIKINYCPICGEKLGGEKG